MRRIKLQLTQWPLLIGLAACNPPADDATPPDAAPRPAAVAPEAAAASRTPAQQAFQQVNERMHAAMTATIDASPDVAFAQSMVPHHQGAIDMARVQLQYGTDPEMRRLAQEVIAAQEAEIAQLNAFLAKRGAPTPPPAPQDEVDHSAMGD